MRLLLSWKLISSLLECFRYKQGINKCILGLSALLKWLLNFKLIIWTTLHTVSKEKTMFIQLGLSYTLESAIHLIFEFHICVQNYISNCINLCIHFILLFMCWLHYHSMCISEIMKANTNRTGFFEVVLKGKYIVKQNYGIKVNWKKYKRLNMFSWHLLVY